MFRLRNRRAITIGVGESRARGDLQPTAAERAPSVSSSERSEEVSSPPNVAAVQPEAKRDGSKSVERGGVERVKPMARARLERASPWNACLHPPK